MTVVNMSLDSCAMLVEVSCSTWTARKLDKSATEEVVHNKNAASKDAARVNKSLFAGRSELKEIETLAGQVRNFVDGQTMPWSNNGIRLLPTSKFMEFDAKLKVMEQAFYDKVQEFITIYPSLISAQAMALGSMFSRNDYPLPETLQSKFAFTVGYMPVPSSGDWRVDIGTEAQEVLKEQLDKLSAQRVKDMQDMLLTEMGEQVKRMAYILGGVFNSKDKNGNAIVKTRPVYPSLLEDAWALVDKVEGFKIQDPILVEAAAMLKDAIKGVELKDLKNPDIKKEVEVGVKGLMTKFSW